jgi:acid stress chaperone HdeB
MVLALKAPLLLTSALFVLAQITAPQAQATVDVSKITCDQLVKEKPVPSKYVVLWLSGYYNGKRNNTIIEPEAIDKNEQKVDFYYQLPPGNDCNGCSQERSRFGQMRATFDQANR